MAAEFVSLPKEAWALIGAAITAAVAYLVGHLSTGTQLRVAMIQAEKDICIHRERVLVDAEGRRESRMLERLESAHQTLAEVSMAFSLTGMYFTDETILRLSSLGSGILDIAAKLKEFSFT
ncbi:hypothetical protein [Caenispirillum bisanense]|uniref:hypothetical protein n=1 Tax=Caenispirillum bisanense TaxID=414052 RepID=UPI0031D3EDF0